MVGLVSIWTGLLPYGGIFTAAIVEGEVTYIAAAALVAEGRLNPAAVLISGALGASIGDQAYFYLFRGRLARWVARYPSLEKTAAPLLRHVRRNDSLMVLRTERDALRQQLDATAADALERAQLESQY